MLTPFRAAILSPAVPTPFLKGVGKAGRKLFWSFQGFSENSIFFQDCLGNEAHSKGSQAHPSLVMGDVPTYIYESAILRFGWLRPPALAQECHKRVVKHIRNYSGVS